MTTRRTAHRVLATVAASLTLAGVAGVAPAQAAQTTNSDPGFLVVYDNNIENMLPTSCAGNDNDFEKLFTYIKAQPKSPDLFTVQQVSNQTKLNALTKRMTDELLGTYAGVVAIANPNSANHDDSACTKDHQTNAVIYRTDRFTAGSTIRWRSDAPEDRTGPCKNLTASTFQDRVENVAVRLTDKVTKKSVNVASIHWPTTNPWNGPDCADENITEARDRTAELGSASLTVLGGDTNATVDKKGWGQKAAGFGFKDAAAVACGTSCTPPGTFGSRRIDFVLAKGGQGFTNVTTISQAAAGGKYSDHLAVRAYVKY